MPSFIDNVDAAVAKLGTSNVGLVWGLASTYWENDFERDSFIEMITQPKSGV